MPYTPNKTGSNIVKAALDKDPNLPALTLARRLHTQNPGVWPNVDAARNAIRYYTGTAGVVKRKGATHPREKRNAGEDWRKFLPEPKKLDGLEWGPVKLKLPCKALVLSDIHVPFHDQEALTLAIEYGLERGADTVILNGDIVDHFALSRWQKDPRLRSFAEEVHAGRTLIHGLRLAFPDAQIYWKLGNHEERYEAYMIAFAPDFIGVPAFEWSTVFGLDRERIYLVEEKKPIQLGKLYVIHGHEYAQGFNNPVNPARGFYLKAGGVHVLGGHYHQTSQQSKNNLEDNVVSAWSTGCLCELHPKYRPLNDWNAGFAFVTVDAKGAFTVDNKRIIDGKVW